MQVADKIVMKKISEIKPYVRNPRKNDKTVALLVDIIPKVGFNVPLVIDKKGVIVKGHARFAAACKLGMTELPCIITEAGEDEIRLDRIADNRISEFSEWLSEGLAHELDMINLDLGGLEFNLPTFDDMPSFEPENEPAETQESEVDRRARYEALLAAEAEKSAKKTGITTEAAIERAKEAQKETPQSTKYYKFICEKCGHVMFVKADQVWDSQSGAVTMKK